MTEIIGLKIIPKFISTEYETELINNILEEKWNTSLKRRTQHYGYTYNYTNKNISKDDYLGPFPDWLEKLVNYLKANTILKSKPDQVIINEYLSGQGIAPHIDAKNLFDEEICSLSLGSPIMMTYSQGSQKKDYYLMNRSLLKMEGAARYLWYHSIAARKSDIVNGKKINRETRYSITFRKVII